MRFGVYYIPKGDFYDLGSRLVGYDIREEKDLVTPSGFEDKVSTFDDAWNQEAKPYGFHLTIGDAIDCKEDDLAKVQEELTELLHCFSPERHEFRLALRDDKPVSIWKGGAVVLKYAANENLKAFHNLVVARINPIGSGSGYFRELDEIASGYRAARTRKFFSPYVLTGWQPHFTILKPYNGLEKERLKQYLLKSFGTYAELKVESLCLVVQYDRAPTFSIYDEIPR